MLHLIIWTCVDKPVFLSDGSDLPSKTDCTPRSDLEPAPDHLPAWLEAGWHGNLLFRGIIQVGSLNIKPMKESCADFLNPSEGVFARVSQD